MIIFDLKKNKNHTVDKYANNIKSKAKCKVKANAAI